MRVVKLLKDFLNKLLSLGTKPGQSLEEARMVRTTNVLNLLVITFTACSFITIGFLGTRYDIIPILCVFGFAIISVYLNSRFLPKAAFLLFAFYINLVICYFAISHPPDTDLYIYFFPVIVSLILLNTATFARYTTLLSALICAVFLILSVTLDIPELKRDLSLEQIRLLRIFNLFGASIITAVLSYLLTRIISRQFSEIELQNKILTKSKLANDSTLKEKEILLAELHHRVKNNLAIISGLLNLQDDATNNLEAKDIIRDSKSRIMSMALVHRMLYEKQDLKSLELKQYVSALVMELFVSYDLDQKIDFTIQSDNHELPVAKSVSLGLIINEVVTNSIKYSIKKPQRQSGRFTVVINRQENLIMMVLKDDGPGFPADFNPAAEQLSLGIYLIKSLAEQIEGQATFRNNDGAEIELRFQLEEI